LSQLAGTFSFSGRSEAWLSRLPWEQEGMGSNPIVPTIVMKKPYVWAFFDIGLFFFRFSSPDFF
jgi:hypothetical protein